MPDINYYYYDALTHQQFYRSFILLRIRPYIVCMFLMVRNGNYCFLMFRVLSVYWRRVKDAPADWPAINDDVDDDETLKILGLF